MRSMKENGLSATVHSAAIASIGRCCECPFNQKINQSHSAVLPKVELTYEISNLFYLKPYNLRFPYSQGE
jgi:hypothetical protein